MRILRLASLCLAPTAAALAQPALAQPILTQPILAQPILAQPILAQVQQDDPNAANRSMDADSQIRALRQEQTTRTDMLRMDIQRNEAATPAPNTGPNAIGPVGGTGVGR